MNGERNETNLIRSSHLSFFCTPKSQNEYVLRATKDLNMNPLTQAHYNRQNEDETLPICGKRMLDAIDYNLTTKSHR